MNKKGEYFNYYCIGGGCMLVGTIVCAMPFPLDNLIVHLIISSPL